MKIKKAELLKFIDQAIVRLRKAHQEKHDDAVKEAQKAYDSWERQYGPRWDKAIQVMQAARKRKQPVTLDMLPNTNGNRDVPYYASEMAAGAPLALPKLKPFVVPTELSGLRALVDAIDDETIEVRQLGLGDIRELYQKYAE